MTTTLPDGRISWLALVEGKQPGDTIEVPANLRSHAHTQLTRLGFRVTSRINKGLATFTILGLGQKRTDLKHIEPPLSIAAQIGQLLHGIREANDNVNYWTLQSRIREQPQARIEASTRALAWKQTLTAKRAKLSELQTLTA